MGLWPAIAGQSSSFCTYDRDAEQFVGPYEVPFRGVNGALFSDWFADEHAPNAGQFTVAYRPAAGWDSYPNSVQPEGPGHGAGRHFAPAVFNKPSSFASTEEKTLRLRAQDNGLTDALALPPLPPEAGEVDFSGQFLLLFANLQGDMAAVYATMPGAPQPTYSNGAGGGSLVSR